MSIGPLRRSVGALGLLALVPIAAMLLLGSLSPVDAALRAVVVGLAVLVVGRVTGWGIDWLAATLEHRPDPDGPAQNRRRTDAPTE